MDNTNQNVSQKIEPLNQDGKLLAALAYPFGLLIAIIVYLAKKDDPFTKFHAKQAIIFDIVAMVLGVLIYIIIIVAFVFMMMFGLVGSFAGAAGKSPILALASSGIASVGFIAFYGFIFLFAFASLAVRLFLAYKAYNGHDYRLPIIGKMAAK